MQAKPNVSVNKFKFAQTLPSGRSAFGEEVFREFLNDGFVLAVDADRILVGWGGWSEPNVRDNHDCVLFAPDFYLSESRLAGARVARWDVLDREFFASLVIAAKAPEVNFKDQAFQWVEPEPTEFTESWNEIRRGFHERGLKKAVPVVFATAEAEVSASHRLKILRHLINQPRQLSVYGLWSADEGILGATPETLFTHLDGGPLMTMALAGTRAKAGDAGAASALLNDPKERYEHQLVVEDIHSVLSRIGRSEVGATGILELPTLYHLKTEIRATLEEELSLEDLVRKMHPTPALGVAPRASGFEEMRRWENKLHERRRFGAPFAARFVNDEGRAESHCVVAIRNIQWAQGRVLLGSGCGIVPQSDPEREWSELKLKRDSVRRILGV